ncbi:heme A synthase [Spongisporangium articulatum]|uniref:Heme A synthase n=1 Tax=Spongisporangium articulatum TaxID=3362603 RepID=A0ABW8ARI0_9ACTN
MTAVRRLLSLAASRAHGLGLRRVLVFNLVMQVVIIFTGGVVRLSGSGLGCPTWPECVPGSYTPTVTQAQGWHKYVEFGNRLLTYVLVAAVVLAALAVWHEVKLRARGGTPRDRGLARLGLVPLLGVPAQAVIGGVSVLTDLNPWVVSLHFLCSALLVAVSTWLLLQAVPSRVELSDAASPPARAEVRWLVLAVSAVAALVVVLGTVVTGSGPHSGDADVSHRFGFDVRTVSWLHADAVWLFVGLVCALILALRLTDAPRAAQRRSLELLGVTLAQGLIGYVQYFTGVPAVLVAAHMVGAALLVAAVTATAHAVLTTGADVPRPAAPVAV